MTYSRLHPDWETALASYGIDFDLLVLDVDRLYAPPAGAVYPARSLVFRAFHEVMPDEVRVIVLGQDPYPQPRIADGLALSARGHEPPTSLRHVLYNMWSTGEMSTPTSDGDLQAWAGQGVLLLNTSLTVEPNGKSTNNANLKRHQLAYEKLISATVEHMSLSAGSPPGFLFFGAEARRFIRDVQNPQPEQVIDLNHPSREPWPQIGREQRPFARINQYLGNRAINWQL